MAEKEKIVPTCRYGHGPLKRMDVVEGEKQFYKVDTFPSRSAPPPASGWVIYSFVIYECPKCSYIELHDEQAT